jgi:hypothetical protein
MEPTLQIVLIVVALALLASIAIQVFMMARLLSFFRSGMGRRGLDQIIDKAFDAVDGVDRATSAATEVLEKLKPSVEHLASVSQRQLSHADQVVDEVLSSVGSINHNVNAAIHWPAREAHAWTAGVRTALFSYFKKNGDSAREERW